MRSSLIRSVSAVSAFSQTSIVIVRSSSAPFKFTVAFDVTKSCDVHSSASGHCSNHARSIARRTSGGGGERRHADELQFLHVPNELALLRRRKRGAHFVERPFECLRERHEPKLRRPSSHRAEERRLARGEIHGRERITFVERVSAAGPAIGVERKRRIAKRIEVAINRANGDAESVRQKLRGDACAASAQILGDCEEPCLPPHQSL